MAPNPTCSEIYTKRSATLSLCSEKINLACEIAVAMTTGGCSPLTCALKENKS